MLCFISLKYAGMKRCSKIYVMILLIGIVFWFINSVDAWWKDEACNVYDLEVNWCKEISKNYTVPYCVTSLSTNDREASDVNYVTNCVWPALTNKISSIKDKEITIDRFNTRNIIELYCLSLYGKWDTWRIYFARPSGLTDSWDWQQTFDSHQSLFLQALCGSFKDKNWDTPFINENALVWDAYKWDLVELLDLKQMANWKDNCSLADDPTLADCDMSIYTTKIYKGIMTDLYKIKYAQVLDVNTVVNFDSIWYKKVLNFMSWYYLLAKTETFDEYKKLKSEYPKTIAILESNQRYYKNVLDTVKIIDNSMLADLADSVKCPPTSNRVWLDFIACALHSSQRDGFSLTPSFVTLLYNELLHYRQFVTFHQRWLDMKVEAENRNRYQEKNVRMYQVKSSDFKKYFDMQMTATEWAERGFEEFNMTYPLHIWILLHLEKWEKFRDKSLAGDGEAKKFYSLSEKLQNAQIPST